MIPVVFIHFGERPEYAPTVIARAMQAGNDVVFLNPPHSAVYDFPFARVYEHMSTNHVYFELACMVRWFRLLDWMESQGVPDCLYCDTDVLLFANVDNHWHGDPYYMRHDFTLSLGTSGHTSFWKRDALNAFCYWMMETYTNRDSAYRELERIYRDMDAQGLPGGVSDMLLLKMFSKSETARSIGVRVGEMSNIRNGLTWDHSINAVDGFEMSGGRKEITITAAGSHSGRTIPAEAFGYHIDTDAVIQFLSLHMQGNAKEWIPYYQNLARQSNP